MLYALTATSTLSTIIQAVSDFVTGAISWMGQVIGAITATGNELLLIGFVMAISGFAVGLFKRLVRV